MEQSSPLTKYGLFGWNYRHLLSHPWKLVEEWYFHSKWFFQRGWRGYADCDVWSLDGYLLRTIPNALDQLRKECHGHPCDLSPESWDYILEKMADGLRSEDKLMNFEWETERERFALERKGKDGMRLLFERFHDLWD
jgi:hypothetical protein